MKKIIIVLYLFCLVTSVNAQNSFYDSLKTLLASAKDDTTKFNLLGTLVGEYTYSVPDSALIYAQEGISLARKMKSDGYLSWALTGYGGVFSMMGNYPQAIHFELEGLNAAEKFSGNTQGYKNFMRIAWSYTYLTATYTDAGDYEHALFYCNREKTLLESHYKLSRDSTEKAEIEYSYNITMFGFAVIYDRLNQPNSALKYMQIVSRTEAKQHGKTDSALMASRFCLLGNIYSKKGNYLKALEYYRTCYRIAVGYHTNSDIMESYNGIAKVFWKMNQRDSGIYYANKVLETSRYAQNPLIKLEAFVLLTDAYKSKGNSDSAIKYLELTLAIKDSLFNQQKVIQAQTLTFNEQVRRQDIQDGQHVYQNRIKTYLLISGLIVLLLVVFILFRNNRQKQKAKIKIEKAYAELESAQIQLIEVEKIASVSKLQQAMLHERLRISRELHDDIGSTLSGIVLYSHMAESQVHAQQPGEVEHSVNKIQQSAKNIVTRLNDLVWAVNPEHNTLINLMQKLEDYAVEIAMVKNIKVRMNVPENLAELQLPVESLHNIYLFCKEAINNAVKYSQASRLEISLHQFDHTIQFSIRHNGTGFDMATVKKGNGLRNMHKRADEAVAIFAVQSTPQEGTVISLECKIT